MFPTHTLGFQRKRYFLVIYRRLNIQFDYKTTIVQFRCARARACACVSSTLCKKHVNLTPRLADLVAVYSLPVAVAHSPTPSQVSLTSIIPITAMYTLTSGLAVYSLPVAVAHSPTPSQVSLTSIIPITAMYTLTN
ncbi:hypothetical protein J6590_025448 [Homalodisca vitripennis]|nr:hypothetical protein J6590_025448 [Homalodisca vitripennis]